MRSKTSCFNGSLFRTALKRFWPLWAAYLFLWIIIMPLPLLRNFQYFGISAAEFRQTVLNEARIGGELMGAFFSIFSAMAVWSFLYNPRSAGGMACLPVRREGQFFSALAAGFLPLAAGNLITALLTLPVCIAGDFSLLVLLEYLCITILILLYFYGFATLCAQLTGHILILPVVYGILSFTAVAVDFLLRLVLGSFVYGMEQSDLISDLACYLSPAIGMMGYLEVETTYAPGDLGAVLRSVAFRGWDLLLIYAAVGILCVIAALALFRRRKMETAGDVVAVGFLRPVFRWCMALGCGLCLTCLLQVILYWSRDRDSSSFPSLLLFFLLGAFIGWFAGEMLMRKTFRVFGKRTWSGFGICCAVILALMLGMRFDLFGYERHVPRAEQVRSVSISCNGSSAVLTEERNIARALEIHREILADKALNRDPSRTTMYCRLSYELKNGLHMDRYYDLAYEFDDLYRMGEAGKLQDLLNTPEAVAARKRMEVPVTRETIVSASVSATMTVVECARAAGFADPEEYFLCAYGGYSPGEAASMEPEKRRARIGDLLDTYCNMSWEPGTDYRGPEDLKDAYLPYSLALTEAEAEYLYRECILPDLQDGTLGRIWLVTDKDYNSQLCAANIIITCEEKQKSGKSGRPLSDDFYTHPTVASLRTNAWLAEKGIVLHTEGEVTGFWYEKGDFIADGEPVSFWYN